ncbi:MAG: hypothetical protein AAGI06_05790 [Pseudomonadota bacterium]
MISRSHMRRALGHFLLVLFLVVHAPVTGVMAAHEPDHGTGQGLVICLDGSFAEIEFPAGPGSQESGGHDCLCPCGALTGGKFIVNTSATAAGLLALTSRQDPLPGQAEALRAEMPQTGQGSPRSPPFASL